MQDNLKQMKSEQGSFSDSLLSSISEGLNEAITPSTSSLLLPCRSLGWLSDERAGGYKASCGGCLVYCGTIQPATNCSGKCTYMFAHIKTLYIVYSLIISLLL